MDILDLWICTEWNHTKELLFNRWKIQYSFGLIICKSSEWFLWWQTRTHTCSEEKVEVTCLSLTVNIVYLSFGLLCSVVELYFLWNLYSVILHHKMLATKTTTAAAMKKIPERKQRHTYQYTAIYSKQGISIDNKVDKCRMTNACLLRRSKVWSQGWEPKIFQRP